MIPAKITNRNSYDSRKDMMRRYLGTFNAPPIIVRDGALLLVEAACGHSRLATLSFILRQYAGHWWLAKRVAVEQWWERLIGAPRDLEDGL